MARILHYISIDDRTHPVSLTYGPMAQALEYIVITEEDDEETDEETKDGFLLTGFKFYNEYQLQHTGVLPTERVLVP